MAYRIVLMQVVAVLATASVMSLVGDGQAEAAVLAGGVGIVPTALYAWQSGRTRHAGRLLGQGVGKILLTLSLMALVFALYRPAALGFFAAFALMQGAYVVTPLVWKR